MIMHSPTVTRLIILIMVVVVMIKTYLSVLDVKYIMIYSYDTKAIFCGLDTLTNLFCLSCRVCPLCLFLPRTDSEYLNVTLADFYICFLKIP